MCFILLFLPTLAVQAIFGLSKVFLRKKIEIEHTDDQKLLARELKTRLMKEWDGINVQWNPYTNANSIVRHGNACQCNAYYRVPLANIEKFHKILGEYARTNRDYHLAGLIGRMKNTVEKTFSELRSNFVIERYIPNSKCHHILNCMIAIRLHHGVRSMMKSSDRKQYS